MDLANIADIASAVDIASVANSLDIVCIVNNVDISAYTFDIVDVEHIVDNIGKLNLLDIA